ncbi:efflux RND transporter periplasmic adaptor subunit [Halalkalibaculum sp. DA3122]|uniref:efflux RND transporter periplasmic adaptor subunit n=1 Tax=Halalkalibaculum sp. DA3122 TaxID=3373607 RepID=UPI003754E74C
MNVLSTKVPRPLHLAAVLLAAMLWSSCGGGTETEQGSEVLATPPSLSSHQAEVVRLSEQQAENLNIRTYSVEQEEVTFTIDAPGQVFAAPQRISVVSAPINGRISNIYVHEGERVERGDPLLDLESLEFANLAADYLEARAEITYQQQQVERLKVLTEENISPRRTLERAQADLFRAQAKQSAAQARLRAVGITEQTIRQWDPATPDPVARLTIYAPIGGVLNQHLIELGESVNAYEELLDIIDNTEVLVRGFVSPADAPFLKVGSQLVITERSADGIPQSHMLDATVTSINPALDETNKSIVLNSIVKTENGWPIVGQNVRLRYSAQPGNDAISIPMSAIQFDGSDATVYVQRSALEYQKRVVSIQRMTQDHAIIGSGLEAGENIAVTQVFSLKALERFEQFAD